MKDKKKEIKETETFDDIMTRSQRKQYQSMLKEENFKIDDINKNNYVKEEKNIEENKQITRKEPELETENSNEKNIIVKLFSVISFLLSIGYFIFCIYGCKGEINNLFLIINSIIIVIFTFFIMLS